MSIKLMARVWELDVSHPKRLILLSLADHADDAGRSVRPSVAYTAWKCGYKARQVRNIIRDLRASGALSVVRPAGHHRPIEYQLRLEALPVKAPFPRRAEIAGLESSNTDSDNPRGANGDLRGANHDIRPAIAIAAESSVEPSDETSGRAPHLVTNGNGLQAKDLTSGERFQVRRWVASIAKAPEALRAKRTEEARDALQRMLRCGNREQVERIMAEAGGA